jgi:hypothetical protein
MTRTTFHLSPGAPIGGTSFLAQADLVPADIVRRFGRARGTDDFKCSATYTFQDNNGNVYTLYDWKCTSAWEIGGGNVPDADFATLPSPDEFWASESPVPLNIGGHPECGDVKALIEFLGGNANPRRPR